MQTINLDISRKGILPPLYTKQGDVGRKVRFAISDGGVPYNIPEDAMLSVWYSGSSGEGNYDSASHNDKFSIDGNAVTVESIPQMLIDHGSGTLCLVISTSDGRQIGLWNLLYQTEAVPGMGSDKVKERYDSLFERTDKAISAAENAATDATAAANDARAVAEGLEIAKANGEFNGEKGEKGDPGDYVASLWSSIKEKPPINPGIGENSVVIGDGDANGDYSVAGGTNDKSLISDLVGSGLLATLTSVDRPAADGDMSMSFGAGTKSITAGSMAIGALSKAGCKGFYWHSFDFTNKKIQLSTVQKPYYTTTVLGSTVEYNEISTWDTDAANILSNWKVGDAINIMRIDSHKPLCSKITAIDSANGILTVDKFPFTAEEVKVAAYKVPTFIPQDCSVCNPYRPEYGVVEIGLGGFALGLENTAAGSFSQAYGSGTLAASNFGHTEGKNTISGYAAHAEGVETKALGSTSHSEGYLTNANGANSHTEGYNTITEGSNSHAEGANTNASGNDSHSEGSYTASVGISSHAEGNTTKAAGDAAHSEGSHVYAAGNSSHGEGAQTTARGVAAHSEGVFTNASGRASHAEGASTEASGSASHAEGASTEASGSASHAEGYQTRAHGSNSHTEGYDTETTASQTHAEGSGTIAASVCQHTQGKYNIEDANGTYAHILGNGSSSVRSNAHTIDWQGNATWAGSSRSATGADYAEYFEWQDGNPDAEDRVGMLVALDGDKIKLASAEDDVLGIISGTAAVIGDTAEWEWKEKYQTDNFGRVIWDMVEEFSEYPDPETGETAQVSMGYFPHRRLNPEYDPEKTYVSRADRPEWDTVGMLGKLHVRDDGTCQVNGYACAGQDGIATASATKTNMRVLARITDNIVMVLMK